MDVIDKVTGGISKFFLGRNGGMATGDVERGARRDPYSDYLPYRVYDPIDRIYLNQDETIGFCWSCTPLIFYGDDSLNVINGLWSLPLPADTVMNFSLFADPYIKPVLDDHERLKTVDDPLIKKGLQYNREMFESWINGNPKMAGIPARWYRLTISIKFPVKSFGIKEGTSDFNAYRVSGILDIRENVQEILKGARLYPQPMEPEELIRLLGRIFNKRDFHDLPQMYSDLVPIRKQIIMAESRVKNHDKGIEVGERFWKVLTPQKPPEYVHNLLMNVVCGGYRGVGDDGNQITTPYIVSTNVIFQPLKNKLHTKCTMILSQRVAGSISNSLQRRQEEMKWCTGELDSGTPFVRIFPAVYVSGDTEQEARESMVRAKRIWEANGFVMQEERFMGKILFPMAFPFGLSMGSKFVDLLNRPFIVHGPAASRMIPIQGDLDMGFAPEILLQGRKGQIATLDIFDMHSNAYNALVLAGTGSGKSFFANHLIFNAIANGSYVRLLDIGRSYEKITEILSDGGKNGMFIEFTKDSNICLNPFTNIIEPDEDIPMIASIVSQMAFSSGNSSPDESESTLIRNACKWAYETYGTDANVDNVIEYLQVFPQHEKTSSFLTEGGIAADTLRAKSQTLAFNLHDFSSGGIYGRWFSGRCSLDFGNQRIVCIEMEELKKSEQLFRVCILQILNYMTQDLYLGKKDRPKYIIVDEAWQVLNGNATNTMIKEVIEGGYRRSRKARGSFSLISQSPLDILAWGDIGTVVSSNSPYKFLLESTDYAKADELKVFDYPPFIVDLLKTVKNNRPNYSEVFLDTPRGMGVSRYCTNDYFYYMFTSDAKDNAIIKEYRKQGMAYADILELLVKKVREERARKEQQRLAAMAG